MSDEDNSSSSDDEKTTQTHNKYIDGLKVLGMEFTQVRNKTTQKEMMEFIYKTKLKEIHTKYKRNKTHRSYATVSANYDDGIAIVKFKPNIFIHTILCKSTCGDISSLCNLSFYCDEKNIGCGRIIDVTSNEDLDTSVQDIGCNMPLVMANDSIYLKLIFPKKNIDYIEDIKFEYTYNNLKVKIPYEILPIIDTYKMLRYNYVIIKDNQPMLILDTPVYMEEKPEQILKLLIVFHAKQEQFSELHSKQLIPKKDELYNYWTKLKNS